MSDTVTPARDDEPVPSPSPPTGRTLRVAFADLMSRRPEPEHAGVLRRREWWGTYEERLAAADHAAAIASITACIDRAL